MAFDSATRNRLARFVNEARNLVAAEFAEKFQSLYGLSAAGEITPIEKLTHLDDSQRAVAHLLRERVAHLIASNPAEKNAAAAAIERLSREQAFTVLNRLAAVRMAEKRGLIEESVGKGYESKGFRVYSQVAGTALGDTYQRYRRYLFCLFDELAVDLGVLFDRRSPSGLLFPRETCLLKLIELLNASDIESLWAEDETVGWIYQYYNDPAERKKMRDASAAPRNSRELAVRNQFFTPRYVVEFLTDNTLGRIWYEMTKGETKLKEICRYLVRRPTEVFLKEGVKSTDSGSKQEGISQEELLKQPVEIPHRPLKDPRTILMLDPACGSMHFGLYAFDLFEAIYEEAWDLEDKLGAEALRRLPGMKSLREEYTSRELFLRDVPRLVIEHNIHGIDIDPRAAQIAGLSLWLRAQRTWQQQGVKASERPRIRRSNIVCAEPMPGEESFLKEFLETHLSGTPELKLLGQLVCRVFESMKLAGEAGSLLKIEEEIAGAVTDAKKQWLNRPKAQQIALFGGPSQAEQTTLGLDVSGITDETFWEQAEDRIYAALRDYAEQAENGGGLQRRLFAEDAARGFAFVDVCRKRYDVAVMNPPFGSASQGTKTWMRAVYPLSGENILISFFCRVIALVGEDGMVGAITDRSWLQKYDYRKFRSWLVEERLLSHAVDLGWGVLDDANVETAVSIFSNGGKLQIVFGDDASRSVSERLLFPFYSVFVRKADFFSPLPNHTFAYSIHPAVYSWFLSKCRVEDELVSFQGGINSGDAFQTNRCNWEVSPRDIGLKSKWVLFQAGSPYAPFYYPTLMVSLSEGGSFKTLLSHPNARVPSIEFYGRAGIAYGKRTDFIYSYVMPEGGAFSWEGQAGFVSGDNRTDLLQALAFTNSSTYIALGNLVAGQHKYAGYLNTICCDTSKLPKLSSASEAIVTEILSLDHANELSLRFLSPTASQLFALKGDVTNQVRLSETFVESLLKQHRQISDSIAAALGVDSLFGAPPKFDPVELLFGSKMDERLYWQNAISYSLGTVFGRWDIRYATGEMPAPELPDPFAPLPVCPPGMLQGEEGLPLSPEAGRRLRTEGHYPLEVAWDGILVDDSEHPLHLESRVHAALAVLWGDRADTLEHEACAMLGVPTLREWFRRPGGFFADHLKRYSKSRRQAPIYWPLSTKSGRYTLWIYYHRLTDQTLHTALADFIDPKLKGIERDIALSRERGSTTNAADAMELLDELREMRAEIDRVIKLPWKPNLNDGVLITASPLWKLFRLPKWQKDLKACWEELSAGDYDWAHLAFSIWPERVKEKCKADRSIAIAHGLEAQCSVEPPKPKTKGKKKKQNDNEENATL